ncbi:hypothetical protein [Streptomyces sp. SD15]
MRAGWHPHLVAPTADTGNRQEAEPEARPLTNTARWVHQFEPTRREARPARPLTLG